MARPFHLVYIQGQKSQGLVPMPFMTQQTQASPRWRIGSRHAPVLRVLAWTLLTALVYGQAVHCCLDMKRWLGAAQQVQEILAGLHSTQNLALSSTAAALNGTGDADGDTMPACHRKPSAKLSSQWVSGTEGAGTIQANASINDADTRCICLCPEESSALALASGPAFSTELPIAVELPALNHSHELRRVHVPVHAHGQAPPGRVNGAPVYLLTLKILV